LAKLECEDIDWKSKNISKGYDQSQNYVGISRRKWWGI